MNITYESQLRGANAEKEYIVRWVSCEWCHKDFKTLSAAQMYCSNACKQAAYELQYQQERRNVAYKNHFDRCDFEIVRDALPVENGGFRPGALFCKVDLVSMLELHSISEGTVIRHIKSGAVFTVSYKNTLKRTYRNKSIQHQHIEDLIAEFYDKPVECDGNRIYL